MGYQHGLFSWADVSSPDPEAAKKFYTGLFGWDAEDSTDDDGNYIYTGFSKDGKAVAGLGPQPPGMAEQGVPPVWNSYVTVDDVDAALAAWTEAGGAIVMPAMDVFEAGRMAVVSDPEGAVVSLWQAGESVGGEVFNAPGAITWNELNTRDVDAAREFYGKALGWEFEIFEGDGPPYWLITLPNKVQGGALSEDNYNGGMLTITEDMGDMPPHWSVYFASADVDADVAKVKELGGSLAGPVVETPAGRIAVAFDPQGGAFLIIAPPASG